MTSQVLSKKLLQVSVLRVCSFLLAGGFIAAIAIYFPPSEFGRFSLVFSVVQITCAAVLSWPNQAFLRFGRESYTKNGDIEEALGARLLIHGVMLIVIISISIFKYDLISQMLGVDPNKFLILFIISVLVVPLPDVGLICAQACEKFLSFGVSPLIQRAGQMLAVLGVVLGLNPTWELLLLMSLLGYALSGLVVLKEMPPGLIKPKFSYSSVKQVIKYSWAMPIATLGAFLLQWMDLWFIRAHFDESIVGYYAWAYTIVLLGTNILVPLAAVISPKVIDLSVCNDFKGIQRISNGTFATCLLMAVILPLLICIFGLIGSNVVSEKYLASWPILLVLSSGFICQMSMALMEPLVYARDRLVPLMAVIVMIMVCVKTLVNILLIPNIGAMGAAFATVICYGIGMVLQWALIRKSYGKEASSAMPILFFALIGMSISWEFEFDGTISFVLSVTTFAIGVLFCRHFCLLQALPKAFSRILGARMYIWLTHQ